MARNGLEVTRREGLFIVFEGLDGSGTTTQSQLLQRWLERHHIPAIYTREPTDGPIGSVIRLALTKRLSPLDETTLALAFAADRMDHLQRQILPALQSRTTIVCDRYYLSSLAYQSVSVDYAWLRSINTPFRRPDITFFLDVPPRTCLERLRRRRHHLELYEQLSQLQRVCERYLSVIADLQAENEAIVSVDGRPSMRDVHEQVLRELSRLKEELDALASPQAI